MNDFLVNILGLIAIICIFWNLYQFWFVNKNMSLIVKIIWSFFGIFLSIPTAVVYYALFFLKH